MTFGRTSQAQHVVAAQLACSIDRASAMIEQLARDTDEPMMFVVDEVLAGRVRFDQAVANSAKPGEGPRALVLPDVPT